MINNDNIAQKVSFPKHSSSAKSTTTANLISTVFSPALTIFYSVILCSYSIEHPSKLLWVSFFVFLFVLVPTAYIFYLIGRGKVTDFHISVREERIRPLSVLFTYALLSVFLYATLGGPEMLVKLGFSSLALTAFWILISLRWKISGHCAALGALAVIGKSLGYSAEVLVFLLPVILAVAWSRIRLECHNFPQTVAGFALGALVFGLFLF